MIRIVEAAGDAAGATDGTACAAPLFNPRPAAAGRRWPSTLVSVLLHCTAVLVIPPLMERLQPDPDDIEATRMYRMEEFRRSRQERITYEVRPKPADRAALSRPGLAADRSARAPGVPRRRIELPKMARSREQQTLLQPDLPEQTIANLRLPEFLYWSAEAPAAPRQVKRFVVPGRELRRPEAVQLAEPPKLARPGNSSQGLTVPELNKIVTATPRLPLPPSLGTPLRAGPAAQLPSPASLDALTGDASAVLSLHPNPLPMGSTVVVPPANQVGILPEGGDGPAGLAITARAPGNGNGSGTGARGNDSGGKGLAAAGRGGGGGGNGTGSSDGTGTGTGSGAGTAGGAGAATPSFAFAASVPIRIMHPDNGVFDIVIMQSSLGPELAETEGILSGRPVYTVYLKPGGGAEWILRYCAADGSGATRSSAVSVQLGNPRPLRAPYTKATVVPSMALPARARGTLVHGYLTATGQFRDLRAVRSEDTDLVAALEPFLRQWDFRPASRSGAPVEVEILLVIPPSHG